MADRIDFSFLDDDPDIGGAPDFSFLDDVPSPASPRKGPARDLVIKRIRDLGLDIDDDTLDDFERVASLESGRSHWARPGVVKRGPPTKSGERAIGYGQIMPGTARKYQKKYGLNPLDEIDNRAMSAIEFATGADDPIGRRIAYVGGPKAKALKVYKETGQVPDWKLYSYLPKNKETFKSYVERTGGFSPQPIARDPETGAPQVELEVGGIMQPAPHSPEDVQAFETQLAAGFGRRPAADPVLTPEAAVAAPEMQAPVAASPQLPAAPEVPAVPVKVAPNWARGKTAPVTPLPEDPVLKKSYELRVQQGLPDTEELRQKFIEGYNNIKAGKQQSIFTQDEMDILDILKLGEESGVQLVTQEEAEAAVEPELKAEAAGLVDTGGQSLTQLGTKAAEKSVDKIEAHTIPIPEGMNAAQASEYVRKQMQAMYPQGDFSSFDWLDGYTGAPAVITHGDLRRAGVTGTLETAKAEQRVNRDTGVPTGMPTRLTSEEAERALEKRFQEPDYSLTQRASEFLSNPANLLTPFAMLNAPSIFNDASPEWVAEEKKRLIEQHGSLAKAWDAERNYQDATWLETGARVAAQTGRSFLKNLVSGTGKSLVAVSAMLEDSYLNPVNKLLPDDAKIGLRNAANVADFIMRLVSSRDVATAVKETQWDKGSTDIKDQTLFRALKEFDRAVGEDKVLKGRFLGSFADAGGSALSFIALGAMMPSLPARLLGKTRDLSLALSGTAQMLGTGYEEAREAGLDEATARGYGVVQGLLGLSEMLGAGQEITQFLKTPMLRGRMAKALLEVGEGAFREARQEFAQETFQTASGKIVLEYLKDKDPSTLAKLTRALNRLPKQVASAAANEGLIGALTGGLMGGAGSAANVATSEAPEAPGTQPALPFEARPPAVSEVESFKPTPGQKQQMAKAKGFRDWDSYKASTVLQDPELQEFTKETEATIVGEGGLKKSVATPDDIKPGSLPSDPWDVFDRGTFNNTNGKAKVVKIADLVPTEDLDEVFAASAATVHPTARAFNHIQEAMTGTRDKRVPLFVQKNAQGKLQILDGHATAEALRRSGWTEVPVVEIPRPISLGPNVKIAELSRAALRHAEKEAGSYLEDVRSVAAEIGGVVPKNVDRFATKSAGSLNTKLALKPNKVPTDLLRTMILLPSGPVSGVRPQIAAAIEAMAKRGYRVVIDEKGAPDVTDRFADDTPGYKDFAVKFEKGDKDPLVRELQFLQPAMYRVKEGVIVDFETGEATPAEGHPQHLNYDRIKDLNELFERPPGLTAEEAAEAISEIKELAAIMDAAYSRAYSEDAAAASALTSFLPSDKQSSSSRAVTGSAPALDLTQPSADGISDVVNRNLSKVSLSSSERVERNLSASSNVVTSSSIVPQETVADVPLKKSKAGTGSALAVYDQPRPTSRSAAIAVANIEAAMTGAMETPVKEATPGEIEEAFYRNALIDLNYWTKEHLGSYTSFYGDDVAKANGMLQTWAKAEHGRELKPEEVELFHLLGSLAASGLQPREDSAYAVIMLDDYLRTGRISAFDPMSFRPKFVAGKDTGDIRFAKDPETGTSVVDTGRYSTKVHPEPYEALSRILAHFDGNLKQAMDWINTPHPLQELLDVSGQPKLGTHEYLNPEEGGEGVFGLFISSGAKLGSYYLARIGDLSKVVKDMWYGRSEARYLGLPLATTDKDGKLSAIGGPLESSTKYGLRARIAEDAAISRLAKKFKVEPGVIQQWLWDAEQRLWEHAGMPGSRPSYISEGVADGIERLGERTSAPERAVATMGVGVVREGTGPSIEETAERFRQPQYKNALEVWNGIIKAFNVNTSGKGNRFTTLNLHNTQQTVGIWEGTSASMEESALWTVSGPTQLVRGFAVSAAIMAPHTQQAVMLNTYVRPEAATGTETHIKFKDRKAVNDFVANRDKYGAGNMSLNPATETVILVHNQEYPVDHEGIARDYGQSIAEDGVEHRPVNTEFIDESEYQRHLQETRGFVSRFPGKRGASISRLLDEAEARLRDSKPELFQEPLKKVAPLAGSLGIRRADMPQIRQDDHAEFMQFAADRGVNITPERVRAASLKPTQNEYNPENAAGIPIERVLGKSLMVSLDNRVLDGHNTLVRLQENPDQMANILRVPLPAKEALQLMHDFPKTTTKDVSQVGATEAPKAEAGSTLRLSLGEFIVNQAPYNVAEDRVNAGKPSQSTATLKVKLIKRGPFTGQYLLVDGHHRLVRGVQSGQTTFDVEVVADDSDTARGWEVSSQRKTFPQVGATEQGGLKSSKPDRKNLRGLKQVAARYGATIEDDTSGRLTTYQAVAPEGFVWADNNSPHIRIEFDSSDKAWRDDEIEDAFERMGFGVEPDPEAIGNQGTFDPTDPSILKSSRTPEADRLLYEQLPREKDAKVVLAGIDSTLHDNGELEMTPHGSEILRRMIAHRHLVRTGEERNETSFEGIVWSSRYLRSLSEFGRNQIRSVLVEDGLTDEDLKGFDRLMINLDMTADANEGFAVSYVFDDALPHERLHREDLSAGRTSKEALAQLKELPIWNTEGTVFDLTYPGISDADKASELAAMLRNDEAGQYGLDRVEDFENQKNTYLETWARGVIENNADAIRENGFDAFIREFPRISAIAFEGWKRRRKGDANGKTETGPANAANAQDEQTGSVQDSRAGPGEGVREAGETRPEEVRQGPAETGARPGQLGRPQEASDAQIAAVTGRTQSEVESHNRRFARSLADNLFDIGDVPYEPQTVKGWRDGAEETLLERGVDGAIEEYRRMPAGASEGRKTALGVAIATELYAQGRTADLTTFGKELTENIGNAAQELRAAALIARLEPAFAQVTGDKITNKAHGRGMTNEERERVDELARQLQEAADAHAFTQAALEEAQATAARLADHAAELEVLLKEEQARAGSRNEAGLQRALDEALAAAEKYKKMAEAKGRRPKGVRKEIEEERPNLVALIQSKFPGSTLKSSKPPRLAPNGKPSNLSEGLYKLVRTKDFKGWFGDWEKDPENASKAVDENGEPKVLRHGSQDETITSFWMGGAGASFFTDHPPTSDYFSWRDSTPAQRTGPAGFQDFLAAEEEFGADEGYWAHPTVYPVFLNLRNPKIGTADEIDVSDPREEVEMPLAEGHDGIIVSGVNETGEGRSTTYAVFKPNQIKSIFNQGTFDPNEDSILKMTAWHGSPHKFEKFDISKIGTGEGNAAYGWGLYFAGSDAVSHFYKGALSKMHQPMYFKGKRVADVEFLTSPSDPELYALDLLRAEVRRNPLGDMELHRKNAIFTITSRRRQDPNGWGPEEVTRKAQAILEGLDLADITFDEGSRYKVNLKPAEDEYLMWDLPIEQQSDKVRPAVEALIERINKVPKRLHKWVDDTEGDERPLEPITDGASFYRTLRALAEYPYYPAAEKIHAVFPEFKEMGYGGSYRASQLLKAAGVRGNKYLDGDSRSGGKGTYNYVIFDDADVEIEEVLKKAAPGTPAFKKWFGNSKVVDADGQPLMLIHGTHADEDFDTFENQYRYDNAFFFTDDPSASEGYSRAFFDDYANRVLLAGEDKAGARSIPVYLKMENPLIQDLHGADDGDVAYLISRARALGYDGVIAQNTFDGNKMGDQYIVWDARQIKSAVGNSGEFDPNQYSFLKKINPSDLSIDGPTFDALVKVGAAKLIDELPKGLTPDQFDSWLRQATNGQLTPIDHAAIHAMAYQLSKTPGKPMSNEARQLLRNRLEHARRADATLGTSEQRANDRRAAREAARDKIRAGEAYRDDAFANRMLEVAEQIAAEDSAVLMAFGLRETPDVRKLQEIYTAAVPDGKGFRDAMNAGKELLDLTKAAISEEKAKAVLGAQATEKDIADMKRGIKDQATEERLKRKALQQQFDRLAKTPGRKALHVLLSLYNLPRSVMFSGDLGFMFAQGAPTLLMHPSAWLKAMGKGVPAAMLDKKFENLVTELYNTEERKRLEGGGVKFEQIGNVADFNEDFMSDIARRIPVVKQTNRAHSLTTDLFRLYGGSKDLADLDRMYEAGKLTPHEYNRSKEFLLRKWVNVMSGKGYLGILSNLAAPSAQVASAPRYTVSAFQIPYYANPVRAALLPKGARKIMMKNSAKIWTPIAMLMGALSYLGLINGDPEDKDFLQIDMSKLVGIPDMKLNLVRALKEPLRVAAGLPLKMAYYAANGNREGVERIQKQYYAQFITDPFGGVPSFWASKAHPTISMVGTIYTGKNFVGEPAGWMDILPLPLGIKEISQSATYDRKQSILKSGKGGDTAGNCGRVAAGFIGNFIGFGANSFPGSDTTAATKQLQSMMGGGKDDRTQLEKDQAQKANQLERLIREGYDVSEDIIALLGSGQITAKQANQLKATMADDLGDVEKRFGMTFTPEERITLMNNRRALKVLDYLYSGRKIDWRKIDAGLRFATPEENRLNGRAALAQAEAIVLQAVLRSTRLTGSGVSAADVGDMVENANLSDAERSRLQQVMAEKTERSIQMANTDEVADMLAAAETAAEKERLREILVKKAQNANKRGTLTPEELEKIKKVVPGFDIVLRPPKAKQKKGASGITSVPAP